MGKKSVPEGQGELIDVLPANSRQIKTAARNYKKIVAERVALTQREVVAKEKLKTLVTEANIIPDADGVRTCDLGDGFIITIQPRDELVKVKTPKDDEDGAE